MNIKAVSSLNQHSTYKKVFIIAFKTLAVVLLLTPIVNFWYLAILLGIERLLPPSFGLNNLTIGDVLSFSTIMSFAIIIAVIAAIYFSADFIENAHNSN